MYLIDFILFCLGISLRKVDPQQQNAQRASYNQGDLMREIRDGKIFAKYSSILCLKFLFF